MIIKGRSGMSVRKSKRPLCLLLKFGQSDPLFSSF